MSKTITIETVKKLVDDYDGRHKANRERQKILKDLVNQYGLELVSAAAGLTESTLHQYIRVKHTPSISSDSVEQATSVLKKAEQQH